MSKSTLKYNFKIPEMADKVEDSIINLEDTIAAIDGEISNLDAKIEGTIQQMNSVSLGQMPDNSIIDLKLSSIPGNIKDTVNNTNFTNESKSKYIAHRGLSAFYPENTIVAFKRALEIGYWAAECDVRFSSDGVPIIMHDDTVDRTTDGTGTVASKNLTELKALTIDSGNGLSANPNQKIPTLAEYLDLCRIYNAPPFIHINAVNSAADYDTLIELLGKYGVLDNTIITAFETTIMTNLRNKSKRVMLAPILTITQANLDYVKVLGRAFINADTSEMTQVKTDLCKTNGVKFGVNVSNDVNNSLTYASYGAEFITSDYCLGPMNVDNEVLSKKFYNFTSQADYVAAAYGVGLDTVIADNKFTFNATTGVVRLKSPVGTPGFFRWYFQNLKPGDVLRISLEVRNISGIKCKIGIDEAGQNKAIFNSLKSSSEWEEMNVTYVVRTDIGADNNSKVTFGLFTADVGELELRNFKVARISKQVIDGRTQILVPQIQRFSIQKRNDNADPYWEVLTANGSGTCTFSAVLNDASAFSHDTLTITFPTPFTGAVPTAIASERSYGNSYKYHPMVYDISTTQMRLQFKNNAGTFMNFTAIEGYCRFDIIVTGDPIVLKVNTEY